MILLTLMSCATEPPRSGKHRPAPTRPDWEKTDNLSAREAANMTAAIQTATVNAAELLGWSDRLGTLENGKLADVIAVPGNPLEDIEVLKRVSFVMKDDKVYKAP